MIALRRCMGAVLPALLMALGALSMPGLAPAVTAQVTTTTSSGPADTVARNTPSPAARRVSAPVRFGKWATLAGAVAMNLQALHAHRQADDIFAQLRERCTLTDHALCGTDATGRYTDPESESIYRSSLSADRRARVWLIAGETALLASTAMFIWELAKPHGPAKNVPFVPQVGTRNGVATVGLRVSL